MICGFEGAPGAFSEEAAMAIFSNLPQTPTFQGFGSFKEALAAVSSKTIKYAILPIENSLVGTLVSNYEHLQALDNLFIVREFCLHESLCLVSNNEVALDDITEIRSHPYAIDQCNAFLHSLKDVTISQSFDTAGSASTIKTKNLKTVAAIAGKRAAEIYGLKILKENIEDHESTITRYILLSNVAEIAERHQDPKTSISVSLKNQTGAFFKAISCFALRDINICKIESRPSSRSITLANPWEYQLFIDFDGSTEDDSIKKALAHLNEFATLVKVLGSYPKFHTNEIVSTPFGM